MIRNPVRTAAKEVVSVSNDVSVNEARAQELADDLSRDELRLPAWELPVFLHEHEAPQRDVVNFLFLGNTINFAFRDFETGEKYSVEYRGTEWGGAMGMWAALRRAYEEDVPILDADFLQDITIDDMERIFLHSGDVPLSMLSERRRIFEEVGEVLVRKYNGSFLDIIKKSDRKLFSPRGGIVDRLVNDMSSFRDVHQYTTKTHAAVVPFYKRAQLAPAMVMGKFQDVDEDIVADPQRFTLFADYNLPNVLRYYGAISYSSKLSRRIDDGRLLISGTPFEIEIRAATVYAGDLILNSLRTEYDGIHAPHLDAALFHRRDDVETQPHRCRTTDY